MNRQRRMSLRFTTRGWPPSVRFVGGADLAFEKSPSPRPRRAGTVGSRAIAVALVWDRKTRSCVEVAVARRRIRFPYVPGLLSFREAPVLLAAMRKLKTTADVWMFDGHGISHPRGCGLATHLGILAGAGTVGAAKSLLCGRCAQPARRRGSRAQIIHNGRLVGYALRTRTGDEPIYVSPGFRCHPRQAADLVLSCTFGHRLPEPTRLADALCARLRTPKSHRNPRIGPYSSYQ
jgi:deoxyribonuclease V